MVKGKPKSKLDDKGNPVRTPRYGIRALRHVCASAWIKQGVDPKRLTTWLGHSRVQMSIDVYGHPLADPEGDAALVNATHADLSASRSGSGFGRFPDAAPCPHLRRDRPVCRPD
ncbi:Phage integrase family protein [Sphingopyxis flava]|uniref:Phage integrase family protein n=1 Tax=Sphingopyxis flava TaxID=1507287 RepID=A0A1T5D7M1_9SPHN|nr:Phage integrase family protein [Sphingopyxis flava]